MSQTVRPSVFRDLFLAEREAERGVKPNTLRSYRRAIDQFLGTPGAPEDIAGLAKSHLIAWTVAMRRRHVSEGAINSYQRPVWSWLRWLFAEGYIADDLAHRARMVYPTERKRRTASDQARRDLITVARARAENRYRNVALIETLWSTGIRRTELAGVTLEDVDLEHGAIVVRHSKTGRTRINGIGAQARLSLQQYIVHERGDKPGGLFLQRGKRSMTSNAMLLVLRSLSASAGVTVSSHDFRRACAARLLESGMAVDDVARQLGHSTLTMTLVYGEEGRTKRALDAYHEVDRGIIPMRRRA